MLGYHNHKTIKKIITGFGTLFNDIWVVKYDQNNQESERYKVPIAYGPKQKFIQRIEQEDPELIRSFEMYRPRIGFELVSVAYDPQRKLNTTQKSVASYPTTGSLYHRFEKVPYNLTFQLHVVTKNTDEALQILEQILPYFGPDFCISFKNFPIDAQSDVPISIGPVNFEENYEGDFEKRKSFVINISFVAKTYIYGPVSNSKVITEADVNFIDFETVVVAGLTTSAYGYEIPYYGVTGGTFATVTVGVTGGATAGSIGTIVEIGTPGTSGYIKHDGTYTTIREYPDNT